MAEAASQISLDARAGTVHRLDSLTGLRALGAVMVFAGHGIPYLTGTKFDFVRPFFRSGVVGVSFFFLLSGFVMTWSRAYDVSTPTFYRRRVGRLWPVHLAVLAIVVVTFANRGQDLPVLPLIASLLLVQSWIPDPRFYFGYNGVAWSLSCEVFFYAISPWLLPALGRPSPRTRRVIMAALVGVTLLLAIVVSQPDDEAATFNAWLTYIFPVTRLIEFVLGALLAREILDGGWRWAKLRWTVPVAIIAFLVAGHSRMSYAISIVTLVPFLCLMAALVYNDADGGRSFLRSRVMVIGGALSFSFYLIHEIVMSEVARLINFQWGYTIPAVQLMVVSFVIAAAASWVLYTFIERPCERALRHGNLFGRRSRESLARASEA